MFFLLITLVLVLCVHDRLIVSFRPLGYLRFEKMRCLAEGSASPIPVRQLLETTAVSLHVEDLLFGREGEG